MAKKHQIGITMLLCALVICIGAPSPYNNQQAAQTSSVILSVLDFGAIPNDSLSDVSAFQAAHDSIPDGQRTIIYVPAGEYFFDKAFNLSKSNVSLIGDGVKSVLKRAPGAYVNLMEIPSIEQSKNPNIFPENILIKKLTFDGNDVVHNDFPKYGSMSDIFVWQAKNIELSDLLLRNNEFIGVTFSNGTRPSENVTVRRVRGNYFSWCMLHLGNVRNALVEKVFSWESPTQKYYPAAHSGIDIEMEGLDLMNPTNNNEGIVDSVVIKDSLFILPSNVTATGAIALSPAYGPVHNVSIINNVMKNYTGFAGTWGGNMLRPGPTYDSLVKNITIDGNWMQNDLNEHTYHTPLQEYSSENVVFRNNIINDYVGFQYLTAIRGGRNITVENNSFQSKTDFLDACMIQIEPNPNIPSDKGESISFKGNKYFLYSQVIDIQSACLSYVSPSASNVTLTNNQILPALPTRDIQAPKISSSLAPQTVVKETQEVSFNVFDEGERVSGIARVMYLLDGIPVDYSETPPFRLTIEPKELINGEHTVGAIAWDKKANISDEFVVPFHVEGVASPLPPSDQKSICGFTGITKGCPVSGPQAVIKAGKSAYFLSPTCQKRPVLSTKVQKSYCGGKISVLLDKENRITALPVEKTVFDPKGKQQYRLNVGAKTLRRLGRNSSTGQISRLSAEEFRLYRLTAK